MKPDKLLKRQQQNAAAVAAKGKKVEKYETKSRESSGSRKRVQFNLDSPKYETGISQSMMLDQSASEILKIQNTSSSILQYSESNISNLKNIMMSGGKQTPITTKFIN